MWKFELQCLLDDLVDLSIFINACLPQIYYLMAVDYREPGQEKKTFVTCYLNGVNILFFHQNCYRWLKLITCVYTCREEYTLEKKITMHKKHD